MTPADENGTASLTLVVNWPALVRESKLQLQPVGPCCRACSDMTR